MKYWLKLVRIKNLMMMILIFVLIKFSILEQLPFQTNLNTGNYLLLSFSIIFIMAAGYVLNDVCDLETDKINRNKSLIVGDKISVKKAKIFYVLLSCFGLLLGLLFSYRLNRPFYFIFFLIPFLLLITYSKVLKYKFLIGNLIVGFLLFISIYYFNVFELYPIQNTSFQFEKIESENRITALAIFAFLLTLLREIAKDAEDIPGDIVSKSSSLPIKLGLQKTNTVLVFLTSITLIFVIIFIYKISSNYLKVYLVLGVIFPLLYFAISINKNNKPSDYTKSTKQLKLIMFIGILSILFF
ncbi:geranylgeranylglycerol-phosphate geranylgeranyltransferase [Namhaeicola litoreus]|uniref:Geranylgeranylglycerol-phosphate geranylgeranyltransferase n=1 Tax=Namhaeicola litoreus TaxID=1052145 RepID=A0ABW3Y4F3_9FLAO